MTTWRVDADRLWQDIMALAEITEPERPWTRRSFTPLFDEGRAWLRRRMEQDGLSVALDAAGNLIGRREGRIGGAPAIALGSHSDTVPSGGRFDGVAGICAGLEVARSLDEHGIRLNHPLEVIDFLAEEPSEFGLSCIGSRGMVGELSGEMLAARHPDGRTLRDGIAQCGGRPERLTGRLRDDIAAYLELHIEQARALETTGLSVGILTSIAAVTRISVVFEGKADHAGATPLELRSDALLAASETVLATRREAERIARGSGQYFVATAGVMNVAPNVPNIVPANARVTVDVRSGAHEDAETFIASLDAVTADAAAGFGATRAEFRIISRSRATTADARLRRALAEAATALDLSTMQLASGAGHDALFLSAVAPIGMVLTRCLHGKSHCPEEWAEKADLRDGANIVLNAVAKIDEDRW